MRWEDSTLGSLVLFSERVLQHLLDYFSPFHHLGGVGGGFSPFLFFTSLNSCLSETLSLGPRSTVVTMATEAFLLPPC